MKYFQNCKTKEEVKRLYKELAKVNHPDKGGDTATMQAINAEYTRAINLVLSNEDLTSEEVESEILNAEQYANAVQSVINLQDINIELCGGWLWITGNGTYAHRSKAKGGTGILPENGFYFASKKVAWYFRSVEYKTNNRKSLPLTEIRKKYGSQQINSFSYKILAR